MPQITYKEYETHPEGSYAAHITAIEQIEMQYGPTLKIYLTTEEGTLEALCSLSYTPKSKLTSLARAVFGNIPPDLDTDDLLSRSVGVVVQNEEKGEVTYSKVVSFHRLKQDRKKKSADPFEE